jgi:hypothetical protein
MEKRVELRLWRLSPAGRSGVRLFSVCAAGLDGGGRDVEWECEILTALGLGGFGIAASGRSA